MKMEVMNGFVVVKDTFKGGVHPKEWKELTESKPLEIMPLPKEIILPLQQHLGNEAVPIVKKKDKVVLGQIVAQPVGYISAPIHSPVNGVVKDIKSVPSPFGFPKKSIIITPEDSETKQFFEPLDPYTITSEQIIERVKEAGIVGMGGASFPTFVKLTPPKDKQIDTLIINACECEPYLTRDYRIILERTDEFLAGVKLIMKALKVEKAIIGIEDNKPKAIEILNKYLLSEPSIKLYVLKTRYPQGAEKMLIYATLRRVVPAGKLPLDVGVVVQNVATSLSVYQAVVEGKPQIEAILTVSGKGVVEPKNLIVKIGTPIQEILNYCSGLKQDASRIIFGGPMMGVPVFDLRTPVIKATSGILVLTEKETRRGESLNCVRCGKCIEVCPINLYPTKLARLSEFGKFEEALKLGIMNCMECGTCQYNCPSDVPIVHFVRIGKNKAKNLKIS
ncbi:MAG: electron transport complex subunit RsxC [Ignavibacteria bacterium]|nr:electron transport complex subunit RsxC [Ignavibacteria bacterium]